MAAYNRLNGEYCTENKKLLTDILRNEWGFDGVVMSDWSAICDRSKSLAAGCDLLMPGNHNFMEAEVIKDVKEGKLSKDDIRRAANRVKEWISRYSKSENALPKESGCDYDHHHNIALKAAEQSAVLLKNDDNILPLTPGAKIAALGAMYENIRYQGAGSSLINPVKLSQISEHIENGGTATECETAVIFTGLPAEYESEGFDRADLKLPESEVKLIEETAAANPNTIVVIFAGGVVETPWIDKVKAVLFMGLPGQAGAEAVKNLLYGFANPCGKLAESWCMEYVDCPSADSFGSPNPVYSEGVYVGYRYYEKNAKTVRFPFGFGLSYTRFEYSKLVADENSVSVRVKNTGSRLGGEAVLLYVNAPENSAVDRPKRELKGFSKVFLAPNEETTVKFTLDKRSFAVWQGDWVVPGGIYTLQIGDQTAEIDVPGDTFAPTTYTAPAYEETESKPGTYTLNDTPETLAKTSLFAKTFLTISERILLKWAGGVKNSKYEFLRSCFTLAPLRACVQSGGVSMELAKALVDTANGKIVDSAGHLLDLFVAKAGSKKVKIKKPQQQ
jgi:beta-glucosidase